jgi:ABC-type nitrate/sulfonate/bicarbonate transport system permease component
MKATARHGRTKVLAWQLVIVGGFLLSWTLVSLTGIGFQRLFPPPWRVVSAAIELLLLGTFFSHLAFSLHEVVWGFCLGAGAGIVIGLILGGSRIAGAVLEPIVLWLAPVPKIIIYPIFLWFLGIGGASRIAMGVASCFFPVVIYTTAGVRGVKPVLVDAARLLGANRLQLMTRIYLPAMLASLWLGLRLGAAVSLVGILLAETKLSQKGLGFLVIEHYNHFQIVEMYAVLLLIFSLAIAINSLFGLLQDKLAVLRARM